MYHIFLIESLRSCFKCTSGSIFKVTHKNLSVMELIVPPVHTCTQTHLWRHHTLPASSAWKILGEFLKLASPGLDVFEEGSPPPQHIPGDFCLLCAGHGGVSSYLSNCCQAGPRGGSSSGWRGGEGERRGEGMGGLREGDKNWDPREMEGEGGR